MINDVRSVYYESALLLKDLDCCMEGGKVGQREKTLSLQRNSTRVSGELKSYAHSISRRPATTEKGYLRRLL